VGDKLDRGGEMSTPDVRLSAAERAALADLEAAAVAADPGLAALLRGRRGRHVTPALRSVRLRMVKISALVMRMGWLAVPLSVVGVLLMVLGLGSGLGLSLLGALLTALGLRVLAEMALVRMSRIAALRRGRAS
jgi:hypothetical protein